MTGVAALLLAAALGHAIARWSGSPPTPFLVLAGFALAATGVLSGDFLADALLLGITFMLFIAGIEMDPRRVGSQGRAALKVGVAQFALLGGVGFGAALLLGFGGQESGYLALALAASSTLVAVRLLQRRRQLFEPFGRLVIGVLLLQDLLVILTLPVLTQLPQGPGAVVAGVGGVLALTVLAWFFLSHATPWIVARLENAEEHALLVILSYLFVFLFLADATGVPFVAGAFLAGVSLSSFPVNGIVRGQLASISDFFTAIFFTALGASVAFPGAAEVWRAAVFAGVVLVVTPAVVVVLAERAEFSARSAILSGLLLSQTSEFSLVIGIQGVALAQIAPEVLQVIVLVTLATMAVTPFLVSDGFSLALLHWHPFRRVDAVSDPPSDHLVLFGCGTSGMPLLETLVVGPHRIIAVDDDPKVVEVVRSAGIEVVRGDATDPQVLRRAGVDRARVVVSTVRRPEDNARLLALAGETPVLVRVFNDEDSAWVRARGGIPITVADAAADEFLAWYDGWSPGGSDTLEDEELEDVL